MISLSSDTAAYQSSSHFPIIYYVSSQVSMGAFSQLSAFDILNWGECGNYIHLFIHSFIFICCQNLKDFYWIWWQGNWTKNIFSWLLKISSLKMEWVYPYQNVYKTLYSSNNHGVQSTKNMNQKKYIYIGMYLLC